MHKIGRVKDIFSIGSRISSLIKFGDGWLGKDGNEESEEEILSYLQVMTVLIFRNVWEEYRAKEIKENKVLNLLDIWIEKTIDGRFVTSLFEEKVQGISLSQKEWR